MIDLELRNLIDGMVASGFRYPEPLTADALRALMDNNVAAPAIEIAEVRDRVFAGPAGDVTARLYHPRPGESLPLVVMAHGGGWVIGTLETHDGLSRALVRDSGCALLSIDYRRAPEHPFPAPLEDCLSVIAALPDRAAELGIDLDRWAVTGDSAGGNLATAIALKFRGRSRGPMAQVLFYPVTDNDFTTPSYGNSAGLETLSPDHMRFYWQAYIGDAVPDQFAAPLRAPDLTGVAPATIILAGNDVLHDEGFAYAVRLRGAGVATDLHVFSGAVHGFANFVGMSSIADDAVRLAAGALNRALIRDMRV